VENFFKESTLVLLRELALRQTAHEVDLRQPATPARGSGGETDATAASVRAGRDRILLYVTADPSTAVLIRRGKRVADYLKADCFAVSVQPEAGLSGMSPAQREAVEKHLNFARNLHIEARLLQGADTARALVEFARLHQVTQIFLLRPKKKAKLSFLSRSLVQRVVRLAHDMQFTIVAERHRTGSTRRLAETGEADEPDSYRPYSPNP
jgi:two-component system sensor histidine kinase KdpD